MHTDAILIFVFFLALCAGCFLLYKVYQINPDIMFKVINYLLLIVLAVALSGVSVLVGDRMKGRGNDKFHSNLLEVKKIWGGDIRQKPPAISYVSAISVKRNHWKTGKPYWTQETVRKDIKIKKSDIYAGINRDIRKKGLHLYNGFILKFKGSYEVKNPLNIAMNVKSSWIFLFLYV